MIGLIISGHGNFASGMVSSLTLIAGTPTQCVTLDFIEGDTTDRLEAAMEEAIESLNECEGVIMCTDLAGGSPFKSACIVSAGNPKVEVLAGCNLPMLIEMSLMRQFEMDVRHLADKAVKTGKDQILRFEYVAIEKHQADDDIDGI